MKLVVGAVLALLAPLLLFGGGRGAHAAVCDGGMAVPLPVVHTVTSSFGAREDPTGPGADQHTGVDLAAAAGTPVLAAAAGTVTSVTDLGDRSYGLFLAIEHDGTLTTLYAHLSEVGVSVGQAVAVGEVVGAVGSSGRSTGPHLHFEIRVDGSPVDPDGWYAARGLLLDGQPGRVSASLTATDGRAVCQQTPTSGDPVVAAAQAWLGTPYSWGGGDPSGPTAGICCSPAGQDGRQVVGFDCSGLTLHAWSVGTGGTVRLPHSAAAQHRLGAPVPTGQIAAGDLLFFDDDGHVGIADGLGGMVHAPRPGKPVETVPNVLNDPYWGVRFNGAARFAPAV
ncbi:MAG: peptidoglycan DD-metalloendopeptidase family protein [Propionibacteriaceae bacterium]|nr:peptidoglycan DD-metalloendopeptidase family protein [Propionibacteriaceae bacterium]